jgi:hypothetical protein
MGKLKIEQASAYKLTCFATEISVPREQGVKLLGLLLTWSAGQPLANRIGLA